MNDRDVMLVGVLARSDAIRLSIREWGRFMSGNRSRWGAVLATEGVPLRVGGSGAARIAGMRALAELQSAGLAAVTRAGKELFPRVRLTAVGEARARALCGLPGRDVGRKMLQADAAVTDREPKTLDRLWLDEGAVYDFGTPLGAVEQDYCAAASCGWLVAHSDGHGRAYYAVTPAGWRELDSPTDAPAVGELPDATDEAADAYARERDSMLAEMASTNPEREVGRHPLPVCMVGSPIGASGIHHHTSEAA